MSVEDRKPLIFDSPPPYEEVMTPSYSEAIVLKPENLNMQVCYLTFQSIHVAKPCISVEPTLSRLNNERRRPPKQAQETVVPL